MVNVEKEEFIRVTGQRWIWHVERVDEPDGCSGNDSDEDSLNVE